MKRKKIVFHDLLNMTTPYTLATQCDIFQWMLKTGWEYDRHFETLYGVSGSTSAFYHRRYGIKSSSRLSVSEFLKSAFVRTVVAKDVPDGVKQWREAERVSLDSFRMLMLPEENISHLNLHQELFNLAERPLTTQLNPYHSKATGIRHIRLSPNKDGWLAILSYGCDGSAWDYDLTNERQGFAQTVIDASTRLKELVA